MSDNLQKNNLRRVVVDRKPRIIEGLAKLHGKHLKISDYYGENVFDFRVVKGLSEKIKREMLECIRAGMVIPREYVDLVADAAKEWAIGKGATHFCHWFQPLTGYSAEKQDSFLTLTKDNGPIEELSASALIQGEPDASSFPHGGARTTFEARGYTIWDLTSPMFLREEGNGKILCIPTAFVSYNGEALDVKTPLLRSVSKLSEEAVKFFNLVGDMDVNHVTVTCGAEQEYFLIDKAFYYERPDLVMTGRTLLGSMAAKNQQLSDHYFGQVTERVIAFMQELDHEMYRLGIPSKTRHNEVAPGQFEVAQIFRDANLASDNNQIVMALIGNIAEKHDMVALLHEKPFSGINGSGKHLNWSLSDNLGRNLLDPGDEPQRNHVFLAICSIVVEAFNRHSELLRTSIATHGNDHRLGGHEAPPSIMSVFLGETLDKIYKSILKGDTFKPLDNNQLDLRANQLASLLKDNTDRNRTSPFAFTGNRFEFRAVGSSQPIGFPLSILNAAVTDVLKQSCEIIEKELNTGKKVDDALLTVIRGWMENSSKVVFNGDGYSDDWVKEAGIRGLPNLKTSADAYPVLTDGQKTSFLVETGVFSRKELETRYNVLVERYNTCRLIEFKTMVSMIDQYVIPSGIQYKKGLLDILKLQDELEVDRCVEFDIYCKLTGYMDELHRKTCDLKKELAEMVEDESKRSFHVAHKLVPLSEQIACLCDSVEDVIPDELWKLPKYFDMLFLR
ncbi:MAG: glutamine synthetase III [Bacteriovoracaceae bacterium]|nr:glutamine synthetase III [Bacteriovoracaceae bacterium]